MPPPDPHPTDRPAAARPVPQREPTGQPVPKRAGVLVVDDDPVIRGVVQMGLARRGFEVRLASGGREAVQLYRKYRDRIRVVLLDIQMPGRDGMATLDALREENPNVLVCFMSGDTGDHEPEELRRRGAASVIAKPFLLCDVADMLRLVLHGSPADVGGDGQKDRT